ncbi:hypothetical protein YC2023_065725 [Brassica napus]
MVDRSCSLRFFIRGDDGSSARTQGCLLVVWSGSLCGSASAFSGGFSFFCHLWQSLACYLASPARSSSEAQEDRARFSSSRVKPSASLFLIAVTEDPVSSLSSLQPDLLGGSELLYLLPVFGARFPPQSTSRYKCWGDYQNLATPAMSRGVEESGIRGNEVNPTSLWLTSMAKNGD